MLNKILTLTRPLAVLDFETTGLNPEIDRVIQIGLTIHYPHRDPISWTSLIDPEIPILNDQHGITDAMIRACSKCRLTKNEHPLELCQEFRPNPTFKQLAPALAPRITDVDIAGYNVTFDVDFMRAEMKRAGVNWAWDGHIVDAYQIYKAKKGHTLTNAYQEFGGEDGSPLPEGTTFENAHDAGADVSATEIVLRGQLLRFTNLPRTVEELSAFCFPKNKNAVDKQGKFVWIGDEAAFNFGKWRGRTLRDPAVRGYLKWMATTGDFSPEVKEICEDAVAGRFPTKS